jgi:hypothetical protein
VKDESKSNHLERNLNREYRRKKVIKFLKDLKRDKGKYMNACLYICMLPPLSKLEEKGL